MKNLKRLITPAFLLMAFLQPCAWAKEANNTVATISNRNDAQMVPVSLKQPNRIYVKDGKIERFVADRSRLSIEHDVTSGSLFVIPHLPEATSLFVISDSGHTHAITLSPKEKLAAQNIEIKEAKKSQEPIAQWESLPMEQRLTQITKAIPKLEKTEGFTLKGKTKEDGALKAKPVAYWSIGGLIVEKWSLTNSSELTQNIRESAFWSQGVVAIASEFSSVPPKGQVDFWMISQKGAQHG